MKKYYTIIIALLLFSALNAKNKVLNVSPPPNTPPTIVAAAGQSTELVYCPGFPIANIEFIVGDRETLFKDLAVTFASSNEDYIADSEIAAYPDPATFVTNGQRYLSITGNTIIPPVFVNGFTDITVTVTDGDGLTVNQVFRIYIEDLSRPTIVKTGSIASGYIDKALSSGNCDYKVEDFTASVAVSDDCTNTGDIVVTQVTTLNGISYNIGDIIPGQDGDVVEVTLTAEDLVGKTSDTYFTITLQDQTAPVLTITNSVVNEDLPFAATNCRFTIKDYTQGAFANVTLYEACSPGSIIRQTPAAGTIFDFSSTNQQQVITFNCTDSAGNAASPVSFKVKVKDLEIPVINGTVVTIDANTDANVCAATVSVTAPTASDNCIVGSPIGTRSDNLALNALYPLGTTTITWKVTDANGNVALPTYTTVKVKDMTAPTVITKDITISLNVSGTASIVAAQINDGSTDACGIASYSLDRTSFSCSDTAAPVTVTLTVIDIYGNVGTGTALVTVTEPIIPIARTRNITVQLNAAGTVSILPSDINNGSTDNCAIVSYSLNKSTFDCSNVGTTNIITLTATDTSGNNSIPVDAMVIVQDKIVPNVLTKNITVQLNSSGTVTIVPADINNGPTDNCSISSYSLSKDTFTCANVGSNVISLTATDASGNISIAFATVIVEDKITPVIVTKDINLVLDNDSFTIKPTDVLVSATDACGVNIMSYYLDKSTFTIADVSNSPITISLTVKDIYGNTTVTPVIVTFTTLGINTHKKEKEITIYPNPTTSVLHLQCSNEVIIDKVVVRDLNGKIVVQQAVITSEINVEKLAAGIYTLEADSGKNKFKTKFIKE